MWKVMTMVTSRKIAKVGKGGKAVRAKFMERTVRKSRMHHAGAGRVI
jgi:hypothetical protein